MTKPASLEIIHAYRHLYKGLLRAIQFSKPARFSARRQMRTAFREEGAKFDPQAIERTLLFLDAATRERGLEHRILKNLLRIGWDRRPGQVTWKRSLLQAKLNRGRHVSQPSPAGHDMFYDERKTN
ncbi:hypothetical protein GGS20DRAFT_100584 [Poronia punctata]|nr:hypothetical protein GGS20DRAFT_100584 [Poronia punctata]